MRIKIFLISFFLGSTVYASPVIVLPDKPDMLAFPAGETQAYAADFLNRHLERATGRKLKIIREKDAAKFQERIFIGSTEAALRTIGKLEQMEPETLIIRSDGKDLFLCGEKTSRCAVLKWGCAAAALGASFTAWKDGFSVLPGAAAVVTVLTNWTFRGEVIRLGKLLVSCPLWVVYDVHVGSWSGILCELIAMGSATVSIRRYGSQASTNSSRKRRPSA